MPPNRVNEYTTVGCHLPLVLGEDAADNYTRLGREFDEVAEVLDIGSQPVPSAEKCCSWATRLLLQ